MAFGTFLIKVKKLTFSGFSFSFSSKLLYFAYSSGGYSFVLKEVHKTEANKTAPPI